MVEAIYLYTNTYRTRARDTKKMCLLLPVFGVFGVIWGADDVLMWGAQPLI